MDMQLAEKAQEVIGQVNQVILGKEKEVREVMLAFLANGHVLLEDIPGVGKTTLAIAFSRAMELQYRRVQFTPDVMPSDLTGFSIYRREEERFVYQPGCVFCNLLLADEINRTSPRTQSALLEVMEERRCTVEGVTREVPQPFLVIATQNPLETLGTFPLPEAQMDRFLMKISMDSLSVPQEIALMERFMLDTPLDELKPVCTKDDILALQKECGSVYVHPELLNYMAALVHGTRNHPKVSCGVSPRGTLALLRASQARAMISERVYVVPEDIKEIAPFVLAHRLTLLAGADFDRSALRIVEDVLSATFVPTENWAER